MNIFVTITSIKPAFAVIGLGSQITLVESCIGFSFTKSTEIEAEQLFASVTSTSCDSYPTIEKTNVNGRAELTFKLKLPSLSEMVPITFPFTRMFTPIRASLPSPTDPEILAC